MKFFKAVFLSLSLALTANTAYSAMDNTGGSPIILKQYQEGNQSVIVFRLPNIVPDTFFGEGSLNEEIQDKMRKVRTTFDILAGVKVIKKQGSELNSSPRTQIARPLYKGYKIINISRASKGFNVDVAVKYVAFNIDEIQEAEKKPEPSPKEVLFIQEIFYPNLQDIIEKSITERHVLFGEYKFPNDNSERQLYFSVFGLDDSFKKEAQSYVDEALKPFLAKDKHGKPYIKPEYVYLFTDTLALKTELHFKNEGFVGVTEETGLKVNRGGITDEVVKKMHKPVNITHSFRVPLFGIVRDAEGLYRPYLFGIEEDDLDLARRFPEIPYLGGVKKLNTKLPVPKYSPTFQVYANAMMPPPPKGGSTIEIYPKGKSIYWYGERYVDVSTDKNIDVGFSIERRAFLPIPFAE